MMNILTTESPLTMDSFPAWASELITTLELRLIEQEIGADYHQWLVEFEGTRLLLCYQHYLDCAWFSPLSEQDRPVADWLTGHWHRRQP